MKKAKRKLFAVVVILLSIVVWAVVLDLTNNWFSVRWLKYQVTRNVDPLELQQWATNLLAQHAGDLGGYQDFYGTNMPSGLKKVRAGYPSVQFHFGEDEVWIFGDRKGSPFLLVGAPSLSTPINQNIFPWKPGMYFVR